MLIGRLVRRPVLVVCGVVVALAVSLPAAGSPVGVQTVSLACSDGTALRLTLDPAGLADLTAAVAAIGEYPAGARRLAVR